MQSQQGMDVQAALEPILKALGVDYLQDHEVMRTVRRRLETTKFDARTVYDNCKKEANDKGGDKGTIEANLIVCKESELVKAFPDDKAKQDLARTMYDIFKAEAPKELLESDNVKEDKAGFKEADLHT